MFVAHTHTTRRRRKPGSCNNDRRDLLEWGEERERGWQVHRSWANGLREGWKERLQKEMGRRRRNTADWVVRFHQVIRSRVAHPPYTIGDAYNISFLFSHFLNNKIYGNMESKMAQPWTVACQLGFLFSPFNPPHPRLTMRIQGRKGRETCWVIQSSFSLEK